MAKEKTAEELWRLYEKGNDQHEKTLLEDLVNRAYRFYQGDQWHGLESGGETLPLYNFIRPTVNYRLNMVTMNRMEIVYNPISPDPDTEARCAALTRLAAAQWEKMQMDKVCWESNKAACIAGTSYIFFPGSRAQVIPTEDIYFADEQSGEIQGQKYILIRERRFVEDVREEARRNGVPEDEIGLILPDSDQRREDRDEVDPQQKCTCLYYLEKVDGVVNITRSTRTVVFQPTLALQGQGETPGQVTKYPLVNFIWNRKKDSSRGIGEVTPLIPNQIEANRTLVRRSLSVKLCAYTKPVYREGAIQNPEAIGEVGTAIAVSDMGAQDVRSSITYLEPSSMSTDAHVLQTELLDRTRELAGAGEVATGQVDPTKASGAAIIAAREQSEIPLNEPTQTYRQMVEDIAMVWLDLWAAYGAEGISYDGGVMLPGDISAMELQARVDVTPTDPYSKYALEQSLENALAGGYITFEEYVSALPDNAAAPKAAFMKILDERQDQAQIQEAQGGGADVMPGMQN